MGQPASRNSGQLWRAAWFSVREPRLPPVISTLRTGSRRLAGSAKNSARTGRPATSVFPFGK